MSANTVNRETVRDAFAALMNTALVGTGKPVQAVYGYPIGKITETPTVAIKSGGTARQRAGIGDVRWNSYFVLYVYVFIRDADIAAGWTEQLVEDQLDLVEKEIADCIADNRVNANWNDIRYTLQPESIPQPSVILTDKERGMKVEISKVYIQKIDT